MPPVRKHYVPPPPPLSKPSSLLPDNLANEDTLSKATAVVQKQIASCDSKASISELLDSICLSPTPDVNEMANNVEMPSQVSEILKKRLLADIPISEARIVDKPQPLQVDSHSVAQLSKEFNDLRIENDALDRWANLVQNENELIADFVELVTISLQKEASFDANDGAITVARQGTRLLSRSLTKLQDQLNRERALLCRRIADMIFDVVGTTLSTGTDDNASSKSGKDGNVKELWQEYEDDCVVHCFHVKKTLGQLSSLDCTLRISTKWRWMIISSDGWLQEVKILARNVQSVEISPSNRAEAILLRQAATSVEIDHFVFNSAFFSMLFVKLLNQTLMGETSTGPSKQNAPWTPIVLDTSATELTPDLEDLTYIINEGLKKAWQKSPSKTWLKNAADTFVSHQISVPFLTGGKSASITMEFTEAMLRIILFFGFSASPKISELSGLDIPEKVKLVQVLAENGHAHWCMVVSRLQNIAAKGLISNMISPRSPEYFRAAKFDELRPSEQQEYIGDANKILELIEDFGYMIVRTPNVTGAFIK